MHKLLIAIALPHEIDHAPIPHALPLVYTGVGKLNAALSLTEAIAQYRPKQVINFGTVGTLSGRASGLVEVAKVLQRDMDAEPLFPRGITPFDDQPDTFHSGFAGVCCATGDNFLRSADPWLLDQGVDIVDMELFALARVCHQQGIAWRSFKYVTDNADADSGTDWRERVHHGRDLFLAKLDELGSE